MVQADLRPQAAERLAARHWAHRHLLDVDALSADDALLCLDLAVDMRRLRSRGDAVDTLDGQVVGLAFAEPSTRTRVSFEVAAAALGAQVVDLPIDASSVSKGESLADTLRTLEHTAIGTIVLRHPSSGAPYLAARTCGARIVNAGDGTHAHPTQALLDALTLRDALGELAGKTVAIVGDIGHSRVARSNLHLLPMLGVTVRLSGPPAWVGGFRGWPSVSVHDRLQEALEGADAVMALRVQLERNRGGGVPSLREYTRRWGLTEERMRLASRGAPLLHPGPTNEGVELTANLAAGRRSLIGAQVSNGVAVRMAVLSLLAP
ncbi:MAG TPA: aspartate carbamoyltransferase catalytic subunit [Candidatus Limnocylindria bacterium]|nr:aspartate carbamoyltransferase catalytic subunit [Candidatus Limnocylindria bacterium]